MIESDLLIRLKNHIMRRYELCCFLCVENICSLSELGYGGIPTLCNGVSEFGVSDSP